MLARMAMWIAVIAGAVLSPILLIMDLGRPHLFLNMLRVFKHRSAMSMGAWILTAFGTCAVAGLIALELHAHQIFPGTLDQLLRISRRDLYFWLGDFWDFARDLHRCAHRRDRNSRVVLASHIAPDSFWNRRPGIRRRPCWNCWGTESRRSIFLGFYAAAVETALLIWLSIDKHGKADRAIHEHGSGWLIRIGEVLTGPLALVLRFFGFIPWAAISFLAGALVSRIGWIAVGKVSGLRSGISFRGGASLARLSQLGGEWPRQRRFALDTSHRPPFNSAERRSGTGGDAFSPGEHSQPLSDLEPAAY